MRAGLREPTPTRPAPTRAHRYLAHGLVIDSDIPLPLAPGPAAAEPALTLRRDPDAPVTPEPPGATRLAALRDDAHRTRYTISRDGDRVVLRYPGLCELDGDRQLRRIRVRLEPGADPGLLSVIAGGAVLAVNLMLAGELVLHASAVRVGDRAVAFVGATGMGKSTLATLFGRAGHELVSDDVVRVGEGLTVHAGGVETRLRPGARELVQNATGPIRPTADGRWALRLPSYTGPPLPLAACVVPFPSRTSDLETRTLSRSDALRRLLGFPRIVGWTGPDWQACNFRGLAELVTLIPVVDAVVPWGPPFRDDLPARLVARIEPILAAQERAGTATGLLPGMTQTSHRRGMDSSNGSEVKA